MVAWVGLVLLAFVSAEQCLQYACLDAVNSTCMETADSTVYVSPCPKGYYCPPISGFDAVSCESEDSLVLLNWPGERCTGNSTCVTGLCSDSECEGRKEGEPCEDHSDCNAELYCTASHNCAVQLDEGDRGCRDDFDCKNYLGCQFGECVQYMSRYEGDQVSGCVGNRSLACQSTLCGVDKCFKAVANDRSAPVICSSSTDCKSSWYSTATRPFPIYTDCTCAMDSLGRGVCGLFPGDPQYSYFLEAMEHFVRNQHNWACHTLRRFSLVCMETSRYHKQYSDLVFQTIFVEHYPALVFSPPCVHQVYFPAYMSGALILLLGVWVV